MGTKKDGMIRIVNQNIGCLGISSKANAKQDNAIEWIHKHQIDVIGWQEIGVAFNMVKGHESFYERIRDIRWNKSRMIQANNIHEKNEIFQWGGTSLIALNEAAARVTETTKDVTGLGRWSTILFEGKYNHKVRIISAYNPCYTRDTTKLHTVYNQQRRRLMSQGNRNCPRLQFRIDLVKNIQTWKAKGELIILLMDFNEDLLRNGPLQQALLDADLIDPIRKLHEQCGSIPPPTTKSGSTPIDSIFVSRQLQHIHKGGWLRIGQGVGDHRPQYIDIPTKILFGENKFKIHRHQMRRLKCDNPNIVKKFNDLLLRQLVNENTYVKMAQLRWRMQDGTISKQEVSIAIQKIDNSVTHAVLYAEKKCRKLNTGEVPYSLEAKQAGQVIDFWNNAIRKKKGCNISSKYLRRLAKRCQIQINVMQLSIEDCEKERKLARMGYANFKQSAELKREQHMDGLAAQHASQGNMSKSNVVKKMKRDEEMRTSFRRIKKVTKSFHGATERIKIPDQENDGRMKITTDKLEIEEAIKEENIKKFKLAYRECPFLNQPLLSMIGQDASTKYANQILRGTFKPPIPLSKYTKRFIQLLQMPENIRQNAPIDDVITPQQSKTYWKKKSEKTTSSYSGKHIGTYRAATQDVRLLNIQTSIVDLVYRLGLTLPRWSIDLDVTLLKKPNRIRPQDMRTIGQLEADLNQGASIHFGTRMMNNAIEHGAIPASQYAKKGSRAIEAVLVKVLFFDYLRFNKLNGSFAAMDLMQCFDRMAHPVSSLCSQRLGISTNITTTMISTIMSMQHYVRTAYGDSDTPYGGNMQQILQGSIQGNAAASPMFIAISCVLLQFLESYLQGFEIHTAITLTLLTIAAVMYVDDTDLLVSAKSPMEPLYYVVARMQRSIKIWRKGVIQTGGALRPEKCKWSLISFKWRNGKWRYGTIEEDRAKVHLRNSDGEKVEIERLESHQGLMGLGVCIAPDGNQMEQIKIFMNDTPGNEGKITTWINNVRSKFLRPHDVYLSAFRSIFKTIEYVLPATSISISEAKLIETKLYKAMLPKMGVARNISLAYRYAPKRYQGLGCLEVHVQQYCEKVKMFLFHSNTDTQLGQSIKANLETLHLLVGANTPIFQLQFQQYGFLGETSWLTHLWHMNDTMGFTLQGLYTRPHIIREHDFPLMEKLVSSDSMTQKEMLSVNRCRIYLKVQNMSDITNGMGTSVEINYMSSNPLPSESKYVWPNQPKPPSNDWKEWRKAVIEVWSCNEQGILQQPMGPIVCASHQKTQWTYSDTMKKLYRIFSDNQFLVYEPSNRSQRRNSTFTPSHRCDQLPLDVQKAKVNTNTSINVTMESILPETTINFTSDTHGESTFFKHVSTTSVNEHQIVQLIKDGNAIAASDGSVKYSIGTASWIITGDKSSITEIQGSHGVPPSTSTMTSHRAELYGIYAILNMLLALEKKFNIPKGGLKIVCDNKAALHCAFNFNHRAPVSCRNFDIIWGIQNIRKRINTTISYKHVYGHMDKLKRPLTWPEQLNCQMDKKAKNFRSYVQATPQYEYSTIHLQHDWTLLRNGVIVSQDISKEIKKCHYYNKMAEHLILNKGYHEQAPQLIHWDAIEKATQSLPIHRQIWATKFVSGFCGVAEKMHERGQWESTLCPLCHQESENAMHVMTCTDCRAVQKYYQLLENLHAWMDRNLTHPEIIISIIATLSPTNQDSFFLHLPPQSSKHCVVAAKQQDIIGRNNFFKGHIARAWVKAQQQHLHIRGEEHSTSKSEKWATNLVSQIYILAYSMWEHRNSIVHAKVEANLNRIESDALNKKIQDTYDKNTEGGQPDTRIFFREGIQRTLQKSVRDKKAWLASIKAIEDYRERSNNNMYDNMRRNMQNWLTR